MNLAHCLTRLAAEHPGQRRQYADQPIYFPHTEVPSSQTIFYSPSILYFFNFIEFGSLQCIALHCNALSDMDAEHLEYADQPIYNPHHTQ